MNKTTLAVISALLLLSGCEKELAERSFGKPDSERKILIAGTGSAFKNDVIDRVVGALVKKGFSILVTGPSALSKINAKDYRAVILLSPIQAGKIDPKVEAFIRSQSSDPKIVLFCTRGSDTDSPGWKKPELGVDTVTTASVMANAEKRANELVGLVNKRTGK